MIYRKYLFVLLIASNVVVAGGHEALRREVDEITRYAKKEVIGGHTFIYQEEAINGELKKQWVVDGQGVDAALFERERTAAELAWLQAKRAQDEAERIALQKEHNAAARAGWIVLMKQYVERLNTWLGRLADKRIAPSCWAFASNTVSCEKDLEHIKELVSAAQQMLSQPQEVGVEEYKQRALALEALPERVQRFVYATMQKATEHSDDPHLLKELLELLDSWVP